MTSADDVTADRRTGADEPGLTEGPIRLAVTSLPSDGTCLFSLAGSLDAYSVVALTSIADQLSTEDFSTVVIDLGGLRVLSTDGLDALLAIERLSSGRGARFAIVGGDSLLAQVASAPLTGLQTIGCDRT